MHRRIYPCMKFRGRASSPRVKISTLIDEDMKYASVQMPRPILPGTYMQGHESVLILVGINAPRQSPILYIRYLMDERFLLYL